MCPNCHEPMVVLEWEGIEIDLCPSCRGVWLDLGELELIGEQAGVGPARLTAALEKARRGGVRERRCPRCRRKLRAISPEEGKAVEVDTCPRGHGIWFDHGEVETLVANYAAGERGAVARLFAELFQHEIGSDAKGD